MTEEAKCFSCGKTLGLPAGNVGRSATCPHCSADVRVCYNCRHYDQNSYNECSEPMAERVVEKNRSNFCDYFSLGRSGYTSSAASKEDARKKLDALFKK